MNNRPRVLHVATGLVNPAHYPDANLIDYRVYAGIPRWWRKLEELARIDLYLAIRAKTIAERYDLVLAHSEKVGIPLAILDVKTPIVMHFHHPGARGRREYVRLLGITKKFSGIGYVTEADRDFLISYYGVPANRLFGFWTARLDKFIPSNPSSEGPIVSVGVAKRDYSILIAAVEKLDDYETEIYAHSLYGDLYQNGKPRTVPDWVHVIPERVSYDNMVSIYARSRFVVIPLKDTTHHSAGITVALEASASGKAVIATDNPGMRSIVVDGVTGFLVPPNDVRSLQKAIQELWAHPDMAHQMGMAGRRHVESHFDPGVILPKVDEFLNQVYLDSRRKPLDS